MPMLIRCSNPDTNSESETSPSAHHPALNLIHSGISSEIFVREEGCTLNDVKYLLNKLTLQGSIPEPLRVAQLLAKSMLQKGLSL